jgi:predicted O-linked N-acetylglucosamine transferase (SPINDLY family)
MGKLATALGGPRDFAELVPATFPAFEWAFFNIQEHPLLARAKLSLATGKLGQAIENARQHVALNAGHGEGRGFLAAALLRSAAAREAADVLCAAEGEARSSGYLASLYARALAAVGEIDEARRWHERAATLAAGDPAMAAARVADAFWLDDDAERRRTLAQDWIGRFCPAAKPRQWRRPEGKLVIGYFVPALADPLDAVAVAAAARAHDRSRVTVVGYGLGEQSWEENALLGGAFDQWRDISRLDPATLARFIARDGVHVLIDAAGFAAPHTLMTLARIESALRVAWLGVPTLAGKPLYDAQIMPRSRASKEASPSLWPVAGAYPIVSPATRAPARGEGGGITFGTDVGLRQLAPETIRIWTAILSGLPQAKLLLRANDMGPGRNIERLIARFGREIAARVDVVEAAQPVDFYALVDVALAPRRGVSPRLTAEAIACGVPPVALAGSSQAEPYGAFLEDHGLGSMLVASDDRDYVSIALTLATSVEAREQVGAAMAAEAAGRSNGPEGFAADIEERAMSALAESAAT